MASLHKLANSRRVTVELTGITFSAFSTFVDSAARALNTDCVHVFESGHHVWTFGESISVTLPRHPSVVQPGTPIEWLRINGEPNACATVQAMVPRYAQCEGTVLKVKDVISQHDKLNPKIWSSTDNAPILKREVLAHAKMVADQFIEYLDCKQIATIKDVILTGSNANYNWSAQSDFDLHVVVEYQRSDDAVGHLLRDTAKKYTYSQQKLWNDTYDIALNGVPVEVYVQDVDDGVISGGVYSIQDDKWITVPTVGKTKNPDSVTIEHKVDQLTQSINAILTSTSVHRITQIDRILDRIHRFRQAGLSKGGEMSPENLTFKYIRRKGLIDKLSKCRVLSTERRLSLKE